MAATENQDEARTLHDSQMNKALGAFLVFFALVVLVSIFFTDTGIGKLTNLGAGTVIGLIGGVMLLKGLRTDRSRSR
jgi:uncharacterized membrane protein